MKKLLTYLILLIVAAATGCGDDVKKQGNKLSDHIDIDSIRWVRVGNNTPYGIMSYLSKSQVDILKTILKSDKIVKQFGSEDLEKENDKYFEIITHEGEVFFLGLIEDGNCIRIHFPYYPDDPTYQTNSAYWEFKNPNLNFEELK